MAEVTSKPRHVGPLKLANRLCILLMAAVWPILVVHNFEMDGLTLSSAGFLLFAIAYVPVVLLWNSSEFLMLKGRGLTWNRCFIASALLCFLTSIIMRAWQQ